MDFTLRLVIHTTAVIKLEDQGTEWEYFVGKAKMSGFVFNFWCA